MFNDNADKKYKIMLIEDHDMSRKMSRINLLEGGFMVIEAKNRMEGLKILQEHLPNLIILDLQMGDMDGFKVLSLLKASPKWMHIPLRKNSGMSLISDTLLS